MEKLLNLLKLCNDILRITLHELFCLIQKCVVREEIDIVIIGIKRSSCSKSAIKLSGVRAIRNGAFERGFVLRNQAKQLLGIGKLSVVEDFIQEIITG